MYIKMPVINPIPILASVLEEVVSPSAFINLVSILTLVFALSINFMSIPEFFSFSFSIIFSS